MRRFLISFFVIFLLLPFLIGGLPGISLAQRAAKPKSPSLRILSKSQKIILAKDKKRYTCLLLSASTPLIIEIVGPVLLQADIRLNFNMKNLTAKKTGELRIHRDQQLHSTHKLEWKPSQKVSYPESGDLLPSLGNIVKIEIPSGKHRVQFALSSDLSAAVRLSKTPLAKPAPSPAVKGKETKQPVKPKEARKPIAKPKAVKEPLMVGQKTPVSEKKKVAPSAKRKEVKKPIAAPVKKPSVIKEKEVSKEPETRKAFQISARLDCGYDSNIIQLSSEEQDNFDSSDRFEIESIDDFIIVPRIDLLMKKELLSEKLTELKFDYYYSVYSSNSIKNYSNIGFSARQQVLRNTTLSGGFYFIPSFYLRELIDLDEGQYKEASYRLNSFSFGLEQGFLDGLLASLAYRWKALDYETSFDERDQIFNIIEFLLVVEKIKSLKLSVGYTYIMAPARGDLSGTPDIVEGDISYDGQAFSFGAEYYLESVLNKKMGLWFETEFESRKFTTSSDKDTDPIHSGRKDGVNKIGVGYYWDFLDSWTFRLDYELTLVKTNLPSDVLTDEPTDYSENLILFGITYHLPTFGPEVR
ncbi:MAG: hypothetical protein JSU92_00820 [Deltaproteobacteria bacterium]|nr:MAG: hypothetical protein JSU92_00820 [Deltaproteobacteria bacterium]